MAGLFAITLGLGIWIIGWTFGLKSFDVFMLAVAIAVGVAAVHITAPFIGQMLGKTPDPDA
ncbi:MAG: hypothetical protein H0V29_01830 [Thermoleophilaceae bacterium]|nr:hypothetical protein [Thermoleophilaceae bacterium]